MTTIVASPSKELAVDADAAVPVLQAVGITKSYRRGLWPLGNRRAVLTGADLTLHPGEVVGLVGENGSVKSTLMKFWSVRCALTRAPSSAPAGWVTARRNPWCTPV